MKDYYVKEFVVDWMPSKQVVDYLNLMCDKFEFYGNNYWYGLGLWSGLNVIVNIDGCIFKYDFNLPNVNIPFYYDLSLEKERQSLGHDTYIKKFLMYYDTTNNRYKYGVEYSNKDIKYYEHWYNDSDLNIILTHTNNFSNRIKTITINRVVYNGVYAELDILQRPYEELDVVLAYIKDYDNIKRVIVDDDYAFYASCKFIFNSLVDKTKDVNISYVKYGVFNLPLMLMSQDNFQLICLPRLLKRC